MNKRTLALGRMKAGVMNKLEAEYAELLTEKKLYDEVAWFRFEGLKLRLADNTFYTPDFAVMLANGQMEMHEVKGQWLEKARLKVKVAADQYPFRFIAVTKEAKCRGGGWKVEEF